MLDMDTILMIDQIMKVLMSSLTRTKMGAMCISTLKMIYIRQILEMIGHQQPYTKIQTENSIARGG